MAVIQLSCACKRTECDTPWGNWPCENTNTTLMHKTICFVNINTYLNDINIEVLIRLVGKMWWNGKQLEDCVFVSRQVGVQDCVLYGTDNLGVICMSYCCYSMYRVTLWWHWVTCFGQVTWGLVGRSIQKTCFKIKSAKNIVLPVLDWLLAGGTSEGCGHIQLNHWKYE